MLINRMMMGAMGAGEMQYISNGSFIDESCTSGELASWNDSDAGNAVTTAETNAPAADAMATVWKFDVPTASGSSHCRINQDFGSLEGIGNTIVISLKTYFADIGTQANNDHFFLQVARSDWEFFIAMASDDVKVTDGGGTYSLGDIIVEDSWQAWTFVIDLSSGINSAVFDTYLNAVLIDSAGDCDYVHATTDGWVQWTFRGYTNPIQGFVDYFKVGSAMV
jgi:hypothetical protein